MLSVYVRSEELELHGLLAFVRFFGNMIAAYSATLSVLCSQEKSAERELKKLTVGEVLFGLETL